MLALYLAIKKSKKNLKIYQNVDSFTLVNMLLGQLEFFLHNSISVKDLFNIRSKVKSIILKNKLHDAALIFKLYNSVLHSNNFKIPNYYKEVTKFIDHSKNIFKNRALALSNLDLFTNNEIFAIKSILKCCNQLCILNNINLVKDVQNSQLESFIRFAQRNNMGIAFKNIFNMDSTKQIISHTATTLHDELDSICRIIKYYILNYNYKLDDFSIFIKDAPEYLIYLEQYFLKYNLRYSLKKQQKISSSTIAKFISALLKVTLTNFNTEKVLDYLKTGLTNLTEKEIFLIEIYTKTYDTSCSEWLKGFSKCKNKSIDVKYLEKINTIREKIVNPILEFKENIPKKSSTDKIISAIYIFISKNNTKNNLEHLIKNLYANDSQELVTIQINSWKLIKKIFKNINIMLKKAEINLNEFHNLFKLLTETTTIKSSKNYLNSVKIIASINELPKIKCKIAFLVGATDDYFNNIYSNSNSIFSTNEINLLQNLKLPTTNDIFSKIEKEHLEIQKILEISSEKIYITYPKFNLNAENLKPAWFTKFSRENNVENFKENILNFENIYKIYNANNIFRNILLTSNNNLINEKILLLAEKYSQNACPVLKKTQNMMLFFSKDDNSLANLTFSPSQIETYYCCPFKFLCKYILNLKLVKLEEFDALKYGSFIHLVLEKIFTNYPVKEILKFKYTDLRNEILKILDSYLINDINYLNISSEKLKNLFKKAINTLINSVNHIATELENSNFFAKFFELKIGKDLPPLKIILENLGIVNIIGKIDRLDVFKTTEAGKETNYVRIIDYKTKGKNFNILDILYGQNLQMLIYMLSILKNQNFLNLKNTKFAGIFYTPIQSSTILANNKNADLTKITTQKLKKLRMSGLVLENINIINAMEPNAKGIYIPVTIKDEKIKSTEDSLVNNEQISLILKYTTYLIRNMAQKICFGEFSPTPLKSKTSNPCEYCDYQKICSTISSSIKEITVEQQSLDKIYGEMNKKI